MDSKTYVANAIRTESKIDVAQVHNRFTFQAVVQAFVASSQLLDLYKKNIFYGKPITDEKWLKPVTDLAQANTELQRGTYLPLTRSFGDTLHIDTRVLHAVVGIATEAGELMEAIQGKLELQQRLDNVNLAEEIGDLNWYEALLIDALGADWDEVRERNIAKLRARYPDKFDSEKAINRDLKKEREILEGGDARMKAEENYPFGGSDY